MKPPPHEIKTKYLKDEVARPRGDGVDVLHHFRLRLRLARAAEPHQNRQQRPDTRRCSSAHSKSVNNYRKNDGAQSYDKYTGQVAFTSTSRLNKSASATVTNTPGRKTNAAQETITQGTATREISGGGRRSCPRRPTVSHYI